MIGQVNIEEELNLLESKANAAYGAYKEQLDTKERLLQENEQIKEDKKALMAQLEAEQGNLGEYTERQAKASAQKADLEIQLQEAGVKLASMEQERQQASADKKTLEQQNEIRCFLLDKIVTDIFNWNTRQILYSDCLPMFSNDY